MNQSVILIRKGKSLCF